MLTFRCSPDDGPIPLGRNPSVTTYLLAVTVEGRTTHLKELLCRYHDFRSRGRDSRTSLEGPEGLTGSENEGCGSVVFVSFRENSGVPIETCGK